ncbi:hypothetical protein [Dyadobacter sp. 3J3]|uniref:hypothetical protein n=1 Tax=Dyadobacter sp. 3J3 TaxID=2606600 RepID=UPI001E4239EB|nr:hypothetical protein [Dyadobacter sp. 3J3]
MLLSELKVDHRTVKTYITVLKVILMLATTGLLVMGALFSYQHWAGSKRLLLAGLLFFMIMVVDYYLGKRSFLKLKRDSRDQD